MQKALLSQPIHDGAAGAVQGFWGTVARLIENTFHPHTCIKLGCEKLEGKVAVALIKRPVAAIYFVVD
jgi:hypothetical protein